MVRNYSLCLFITLSLAPSSTPNSLFWDNRVNLLPLEIKDPGIQFMTGLKWFRIIVIQGCRIRSNEAKDQILSSLGVLLCVLMNVVFHCALCGILNKWPWRSMIFVRSVDWFWQNIQPGDFKGFNFVVSWDLHLWHFFYHLSLILLSSCISGICLSINL